MVKKQLREGEVEGFLKEQNVDDIFKGVVEKVVSEIESEYPKPAEVCKTCGVVLLYKTGPAGHEFENTEVGKTKASPTQCRECYNREHPGTP